MASASMLTLTLTLSELNAVKICPKLAELISAGVHVVPHSGLIGASVVYSSIEVVRSASQLVPVPAVEEPFFVTDACEYPNGTLALSQPYSLMPVTMASSGRSNPYPLAISLLGVWTGEAGAIVAVASNP